MFVQPYNISAKAEPGFLINHNGNEIPVGNHSRRSSISEESQTSQNSRVFEHYREPTVLNRPGVVYAIEEALSRDDTYALAYLVRNYGLPSHLRAAAWPLLLRNHPYVIRAQSNKPEAISQLDDKVLRRLRGDIKRMVRYRGDSIDHELIETVIKSFLLEWGNKVPYATPMVWVADFLSSGKQNWFSPVGSPDGSKAPSLASSPTESLFPVPSELSLESDSFYGVNADDISEVFTNIMLVMDNNPPAFSQFISIIRTILPVLSEHFEYEGILSGANSGDVWLVWWLRWLGIRAFPSSFLQRVWDQYFSFREDDEAQEEVIGDELSLESVTKTHLFNCTMLMKENLSKLLEMDLSECRQYLTHMPECQDIEAVITEARTISNEYMSTRS